VAFETDRLRLRYEWQDRVAEVFRAQIIPPEQKARIREFHTQLVAITARAPRVASLPALAGPLFAYAAASAGERDPVADNRAALLVLARYVKGSSLELLLPEASQWPKPTPLSVRLHGRHDLAQHFLISALLTATGSNAIANSVGVAKELDDARHGSGFSFVDLLADEAGNRFGERATAAAPGRHPQPLAALVAAANLILVPNTTLMFARAGMLSADGRCKTFDARANGYARSEAIGAVAVEEAGGAEHLVVGGGILLHEGSRCFIGSSAAHADGKSASLTAPNGTSQARLVRECLGAAGLPLLPQVETHGTGTALGDPDRKSVV
jgi:hypothetical protein